MSTPITYSPRVEAALERLDGLALSPADFIDLAMACLDQGGLSVQGQAVVRKAIGLDPLRDGEQPS